MYVESLDVTNFRIVTEARLELEPSFNLFVGANGSGKTSLLEAAYFLSSGRSFRSHRAREFVRHGQQSVRVVGRVAAHDRTRTIGVEWSKQGISARVDGESIKQAAVLARSLKTVPILPDCQRLLTDGADLRRQIIDWILFHVEPSYHGALGEYRRALRQRNQILRSRELRMLQSWDRQLAAAAERLLRLRAEHIGAVLDAIGTIASELVLRPLSLSYRPGVETDDNLIGQLQSALERDLKLGYTTIGPHRFDLQVRSQTRQAREMLSRGESKLACISLLLAQAQYVATQTVERPLLLLDDVGSELDQNSRQRLFAHLREFDYQVWITSVEDHLRAELPSASALFHVEQGTLQRC